MKNLHPSDPTSMSGYPLLGRLGAGGMGQVFLSHTPSGRLLALKTIRADLSDEPGFEERFAREIRNSDRVRSPWTVTVVDYSPAGRRPQWLATEYVPAPSLDDWVEQHGPLPEAALLSLAAELCGALQAVHQVGLTHRDVKPANVLLARDRPRLIDFGIARAADDPRHTRLGGVLGSPGYLAPDQAVGGVSAEPSDIFSLAAVLVYAATGHGPFSRAEEEIHAAALVYRAAHESPRLDGVPPVLVPLLNDCLAKDPAARPTADELGARLEEIGVRIGGWDGACPPALVAELTELAESAELAARQPLPRTLVDADSPPGDAPPTPTPQPGKAPGTRAPRRPAWLLLTTVAAAAVALTAVTLVTLDIADSRDAAADSPSSAKTHPSASATAAQPKVTRKAIHATYDLAAGESVRNGKVELIMQGDGNLVIKDDETDRPLWAAGTVGRGDHARFQSDGNLVVSGKDGNPVWAAGTFGHPDAVLVLRTDGNVVITSGATVLWEAHTAR